MVKAILLASAALGLVGSPAVAQTVAPAPAANGQGPAAPDAGLAEIIVTATKRASNLQSVPVAVTAITGDTLKTQRINEFGDLTRAAASLTLTENTASPNNAIILRGIGTYAFSIGVEPSVAVIIDDVPVVQQAQAFDNMGDVERIEVLRGPQGTLFGKNASAGAINIVTRDPTQKFEASSSVSASTDRDYRVDGSVSGAVSNKITARLSGYYNNYAGNIRDLDTGSLVNDQESWGVHLKVKIEATDRLTIMLNGAYSHEHQRGTAASFEYLTPGTTPHYNGVSLAPDLVGLKLGLNNYAAYQDNIGYDDNKQVNVSSKETYDLGFANLIAVTSYQDWKFNFSSDIDLSDLNVNGTGARVTNPVGPGNGVDQSGPYHSTEFTQELRLTSKGSGPLSYVAGLFYANAATSRSFTRGPVLALAEWNGYEGTRSVAGFAGVDYKLPTGTTISASGRVNNERIQDAFTDLLPSHNTTVAVTDANCGVGAPNCAGRHTDTVGTWKVSVSQELAQHISTYGSVATGYKGYAYDISSGYSPTRTAQPVTAEHSTAYEIGLKSRFLQNRAQLNIAAFYTDYNNFQAQSSEFIGTVLFQKLNNVGKLRTKGVEVESQFRPLEWMHLDGSFAYTEAKILSFPNAACYAGQAADQAAAGVAAGPTGSNFCGASVSPAGLGNVQDRSGGNLPNSPRFKFNLAGTVDRELGNDTKGTLTVTYQHQSSVNFDLLGDPLDTQKAYGLMNVTLGLVHGNYALSLFLNNAFDTHYATTMTDNYGSFGTHLITAVLPRDSQRYGGIKLGVKF